MKDRLDCRGANASVNSEVFGEVGESLLTKAFENGAYRDLGWGWVMSAEAGVISASHNYDET